MYFFTLTNTSVLFGDSIEDCQLFPFDDAKVRRFL